MNESRRCIGEPISWLRLERYHLGELDPSLVAPVEAHLSACAACAECLRRIRSEDAVALPPFEIASVATTSGASRAAVRRMSASRIGTMVGGLAVAAAAMLGVGRAWLRIPGSVEPPGSSRVKGGDVTFSLVRDDGVRVADDGGVFRDGDRFKVLVTCPPTLSTTFDLVVLDDAGASFPIARVPRLRCGNQVPLPGAFRLTGTTDEMVCLVWSEDGGAGHVSAPKQQADLGERSRCLRLRAVGQGTP